MIIGTELITVSVCAKTLNPAKTTNVVKTILLLITMVN
jgi:hypothetical protein